MKKVFLCVYLWMCGVDVSCVCLCSRCSKFKKINVECVMKMWVFKSKKKSKFFNTGTNTLLTLLYVVGKPYTRFRIWGYPGTGTHDTCIWGPMYTNMSCLLFSSYIAVPFDVLFAIIYAFSHCSAQHPLLSNFQCFTLAFTIAFYLLVPTIAVSLPR